MPPAGNTGGNSREYKHRHAVSEGSSGTMPVCACIEIRAWVTSGDAQPAEECKRRSVHAVWQGRKSDQARSVHLRQTRCRQQLSSPRNQFGKLNMKGPLRNSWPIFDGPGPASVRNPNFCGSCLSNNTRLIRDWKVLNASIPNGSASQELASHQLVHISTSFRPRLKAHSTAHRVMKTIGAVNRCLDQEKLRRSSAQGRLASQIKHAPPPGDPEATLSAALMSECTTPWRDARPASGKETPRAF
ncbi:hypothetical protein PtA15_11A178 [Puccinia triticina]|uniref:Uncharacterized protein n=1 Tax=Puccinia triticina TaxID=208348 RepID=A0ABY7CW01_9BASI|nr:uncharacterized protein PtA15_11A178 [Puccinia triticina]WAQ89489.1 hypothetical protein PtA15_11A178 [Puccinia triticina]